MVIRFWGTRGSLAKPGPTTLRYGGNTSCVEVRAADGTLCILDCGTGVHGLGQALLASGEKPLRGHLLITHTHWDHIQGFPFFAPLFVPGNEWDVYAPQGLGRRLEEALAGQMEYTYFPITLRDCGATIRFHDLVEGTFDLGAVRVTARYLNHPVVTLGYRLEAGGATVVYATDHEPHSRHQDGLSETPTLTAPVHHEDRRHIDFLESADLVIHDSQYTMEEYPKRIGWGHTPAERAVDFCVAALAKRLALFHHEPLRTDESLGRLEGVCRERAVAGRSGLDVFAAAEGDVIELVEQETATRRVAEQTTPVTVAPMIGTTAGGTAAEVATVLIADDDPDIVHLLTAALRPEKLRLLSANDGDTALTLARAEHPDLILLDWQMPGRDGLEVCRALRAEANPCLRDVPVVLITAQSGAEDTAAGFAAGVTDYLTKPFKPTYLRARVRAWLLRTCTGSAAGE